MVVNQSEKKQMTMMMTMMMTMTNAMIIYVLIQMTHSMMMN